MKKLMLAVFLMLTANCQALPRNNLLLTSGDTGVNGASVKLKAREFLENEKVILSYQVELDASEWHFEYEVKLSFKDEDGFSLDTFDIGVCEPLRINNKSGFLTVSLWTWDNCCRPDVECIRTGRYY